MLDHFGVSYRFWRILATSIGLGLVIFMCATYYLWYEYAYTSPRIPLPDDGRVYSLNTHGLIVYLTKVERYSLYALEVAALVCGLCFALIILLVFQQKRD